MLLEELVIISLADIFEKRGYATELRNKYYNLFEIVVTNRDGYSRIVRVNSRSSDGFYIFEPSDGGNVSLFLEAIRVSSDCVNNIIEAVELSLQRT